ncbi:N-acetylmuramoyl-L-alanine amidase LytC precursor [Streptococcus parauberis]|nr:N-acetylmuramoyl-L-alanine amidase LytC precursor [Streptococcus parauberis]POS66502.1 N-acetylmuramoyl-L-alanine amidase LytC precursor [Streptococcus parauberis]
MKAPLNLFASQGNYAIINKVVYLDAGHGGYDPGESYFNQTEKTLNLVMQNLVKTKLEAAGYKVVLTRTDDSYMDLLPRSEKANNSLSDLFVSMHFNASTASTANGIETYYYEYYPEYPSKINETFHNDAERLTRSSMLANAIQAATVSNTGAKNNGVLRNTFAVLRETTAPAVLLELGYMSNPTEFQRINSSAYQEKLAQGIVSGILSYYKTYTI